MTLTSDHHNPLGDLSNQTVLITGAGNGIGRGAAHHLATLNARLVLTDNSSDALSETINSLPKPDSIHTSIVEDLSTEEGTSNLIKLLDSEEIVTGFVHSASPKRIDSDDIFSVDTDTWDAMMNTNARSGFMIARALGQKLTTLKRQGSFVFVTSLHATTPRNLPHYSASKAAQVMIVKELARALGRHGIRVNAVAPGAIPGGGFDAETSGIDRLIECTSMKRLGTPEDVARIIGVLLNDELTGYVTGATIPVDGGMALHNWITPPNFE